MNTESFLLHWLFRSRWFPRILLVPNPIKMIEYRELLRVGEFAPSDRVLDVGCGAGFQTMLIADRCTHATGIDVSRDAIGRALSDQAAAIQAGKVEFRCTPIEQAGLADASFDKVVSICVLEHIPQCDVTLREIHRVLKLGGRVVMSVDCLAGVDEACREEHRRRYFVHQYFTAESVVRQFREAGFRDVRVTALARSDYARHFFEAGVARNFAYRYSEALRLAVKLWCEDRRTPDTGRGMFLVVVGWK